MYENEELQFMRARYYDGDVGRFLSLDPHARDYPSLSDYSYVAGMVVNAIDPDGKDIIITNSYISTETGERKYFSVMYRDGMLYKDGEEYTAQEGGYIEQVQNELIELEKSHHRMRSVIDQLQGSSNTHEITNYHDPDLFKFQKKELEGKQYNIQKGILLDPESTVTQYLGNDAPEKAREVGEWGPSIVVLGHELVHSYDRDIGNHKLFDEERAGIRRSEIHAVKVENEVRKYLRLPIRKSYKGVPIPELN